MAKLVSGSRNPFAFTPLPVTIITSIVYIALAITLLIVQLVVPSAPATATPCPGVNITEAWLDLKFLSNGFHPYNSRRNDVVRNWILQRLDSIIEESNVQHFQSSMFSNGPASTSQKQIVVFNDMLSNLTFASESRGSSGISTYFEGTNVIVYIRGSEDDSGDWWNSGKREKHGGVLVNAHYDSVSTGFGATDDGVGVVTLLQLAKYFSSLENRPQKGIVLLFNNGEEDYLNGARAFARHPISSFPHTFLNLEGAGAGGRAILFRSTDNEVTGYYRGTQYPCGTAVSADGFRRGLIRSQTDYIVFHDGLGMRGLDVAFMEPRARYHTDQDDTKHTNVDSLWHMLSAAIHTTRGLSSDMSSTFDGDAPGKGKVHSGSGSDATWFDLFGKTFVVFELHTLFALSVTLLVVAPIALTAAGIILSKQDRSYIFSVSKTLHHSDGHAKVPLYGLRGFFRFPIIFLVPSAGLIALAFLLVKINPYILYSSPYAVWSMMMSIWIFVAWFLSKAADFARPTALHRVFALLWMFIGGWVALVIATVYEERLQIASGYFLVFYFAAMFLATLIGFLEQFGLEKKAVYAEDCDPNANSQDTRRPTSADSSGQADETARGQGSETEEATESTSLLDPKKRTTFANYAASGGRPDPESQPEPQDTEKEKSKQPYEYEQAWSSSLPSWTWLIQFLLIGPFPIIIVGQIGLLILTAGHQTSADGNPPLQVYIMMAVFAILLLAPLAPFVHRFTYHVPVFLLCIFTGTLIYNLMAFPFSGNNRLKLFFVQSVNLDTGINKIALSGLRGPYMEQVISTLPSAAGQSLSFGESERNGLIEVTWSGLPPRVVPNTTPGIPPSFGYSDWLDFNVTREPGRKAQFSVSGRNTRSCRLRFNHPVSSVQVDGSDYDDRFPSESDEGVKELRLWSREWEKAWNVTVKWNDVNGMDGTVVCLWNDEDGQGLIPALNEIRRFSPDWVAVTKQGDGLVEGSKAFLV